jgi:hypothetical protein
MTALIIALAFAYIVGVAWCMWKAGVIQETSLLEEHDKKDSGAD